ncbi:MAG TPA: complex I NDUFA9 subunit family protein [Casimicrobiaceae bacterium]|jgi:NADH dehydrogenase
MPGLSRVVVLGGSGFVGSHLTAALSAAEWRVYVITRSRARARHLLLLPTVEVIQADPYDGAALTNLFRGADAVVNLVGILNERAPRVTFDRVHVELARNVVAACRSANVRRLLHMSALNADRSGPSRYLKTKGEAEDVVMESGLAWTIFRPSVIFGREDSFLNMFAKLMRHLPVIALAAPNTRFQPVHVADVARCFVQALGDDETIGHRFNLCGPKVYTLRNLVEYVGAVTGLRRPVIPLGPALSALTARIFEMLPGPLMTRDNLASMQKDAVCNGALPPAFDFVPDALEAVAPTYLSPSAMHSKYDRMRARSNH